MENHQPTRITAISGAARGIGRTCAEFLAARGHQVIGLGRSDPGDHFPGVFYFVDFAQREQVTEVLHTVVSKHAINGIVNNVGDPGPELIGEIEMDTVERVMEINLYSAIQLVKACLPNMKSQHFGRIVNISSELALGLATRTAYGAAKAALISASRTWAIELAQHSITSNTIAPGPIDTDFFAKNNPVGSDVRQQKQNKIPMGRIGDTEDVANAVGFFMAPESSYVTGQTLFVDGGSSLGSAGLL